MNHMDIEFAGDVREGSIRSGRNISEAERWGSVAGGVALTLYGVSRRGAAGWLMAGAGALLVRRGASGHCDTYQMLGINTVGARGDTRQALSGAGGVRVEETVTINRSADELYRFWRHLENLPRFMRHLESVESVTGTLSRWRAKGPAGVDLEWNAEIINEVSNTVIGWRSLEGSDVVSAGSVNFEPIGGDGTRIRVRLQYSPPGGKAGAAVARWMGRDAASEIREDLQQLKHLIESGQLSTS